MDKCALDIFMPEYRIKQVDHVRVRATPKSAWQMIRNFDLNEVPASHLLFAIRDFPHWLVESFRKQSIETEPTARIDDFTGPESGFQILAEDRGVEIVIGSIGKFWKPVIEWERTRADSFARFSKPGYGKLAWSLRIDPDSHGGSWISWELRVTATHPASWRKFKTYWLAVGPVSHALRRLALRHFRKELGGKVTEEELSLPGDEVILKPRYQRTLSETIEAPASSLWPWLVQIGSQHADHPEGFTVLKLEKDHQLILFSNLGSFKDTWAFVLEPITSQSTRLITRIRANFEPSTAEKLEIASRKLRNTSDNLTHFSFKLSHRQHSPRL